MKAYRPVAPLIAVAGLALGWAHTNWDKFFEYPVPTNPTDKTTEDLKIARDEAFKNLETLEADYNSKVEKLKNAGQLNLLDDPKSTIYALEGKLQQARIAANAADEVLTNRLNEYDNQLTAKNTADRNKVVTDSIQGIENNIYNGK